MTVKDLINLDINDFNRMKKDELKQAVNTMSNAIRKRIKRFEESEFSIEDISVFDKFRDSYISVKGKTLNQLRHEFVRARSVLKSPTGSVREYRSTRNKSISKLAKKNVTVTPEQYDNFWKAYNRLQKTDKGSGARSNKEFKYNLIREISEYMNGEDIDMDEVTTALYNELERIYDETMDELGDTDPISKGLVI